jgi:hypothetical protein
MIKKFNELYGGEEMDRNDWPNAPKVANPERSDKEKLSMINNLYFDLESEKISSDDFINGVRNILSVSDRKFQGTTNL